MYLLYVIAVDIMDFLFYFVRSIYIYFYIHCFYVKNQYTCFVFFNLPGVPHPGIFLAPGLRVPFAIYYYV